LAWGKNGQKQRVSVTIIPLEVKAELSEQRFRTKPSRMHHYTVLRCRGHWDSTYLSGKPQHNTSVATAHEKYLPKLNNGRPAKKIMISA